MLRKWFPFLQGPSSFLSQRFLRRSSTILALAVVLLPTAWAQPIFKILHGVPGGLFNGVTLDAKGNLYSVTNGGGDHNDGTIFELTPGTHGWTLTTLHSFSGEDGVTPNGGLIFDAAGNLYGTTPAGGGRVRRRRGVRDEPKLGWLELAGPLQLLSRLSLSRRE